MISAVVLMYIKDVAGTGRTVKNRHGSATVTENFSEVRHCAAHQTTGLSHKFTMVA